MSRIYLIFLFSLCSFSLFSQGTREDFITFANQQKVKGDYIAAIEYYEKALAIDSESVHVLWDYAEVLRLYKDYRRAERIYKKVYDKEETALHLRSLYYLGMMQKYNGKYEEAIETFKKAKKKYVKDKEGFLYLKSKQEIESCLWAKKAIKDTAKIEVQKLPPTINTEDSEFGHTFYENTLYFSSLRGDSTNQIDEVYGVEYKNDIYLVNTESQKLEKQAQLHSKDFHVGNGTFSLDKKRFYYSICKPQEENFACKIMVAYPVNGVMRSIDTLGEIINEEDATTTMPSIGKFYGKEVLFFASNRVGSKGGLDIFYSFITDGTQFSKPLPVESINSIDNELTPYFDSVEQKLYFSSAWHYGFGGFDIFSSDFKNDKFEKPENLGLPVNSSANDLYYFKNADTSYFSTNRVGVTFTNNPTCCSDIFSYSIPEVKIDSLLVSKEEVIKMTFAELNKKLPVTLYFHNDIPNPKSLDTTSNVNYIDSYRDYVSMIPQYKREYSKGLKEQKAVDAQEDIESFFTEYVEQGVKDLEIFRDLLFEELEKGHSIVLTVKGFASPLAKSAYNVNLTKRRIASLANYLGKYSDGKFLPYLNGTHPSGTKLQIQEVPFGEYTADKTISDNPNDLKNSIYSRVAALERKIEIQSVSFLNRDSVNYLSVKEQLKDLAKIDPSKTYTAIFEIENSGKTPLDIERIEVPCDCNTAEISQQHFEIGEKGTVKMTLNPKGYTGKVVKSVYVYVKGSSEPLRLVMTGEIK
ncbi:MAG: DUF1573 domain-containing protein [Flavobacteriia bacterium]|jgi:hypothetical protein